MKTWVEKVGACTTFSVRVLLSATFLNTGIMQNFLIFHFPVYHFYKIKENQESYQKWYHFGLVNKCLSKSGDIDYRNLFPNYLITLIRYNFNAIRYHSTFEFNEKSSVKKRLIAFA